MYVKTFNIQTISDFFLENFTYEILYIKSYCEKIT